MAEITAKMVADLRAATGLGMMECKKALVEAEGNFEKAEEILRIKSGAKAGKLAGRTAAEGVLAYAINGNVGALVEVNCETDFGALATEGVLVEFKGSEDVARKIGMHIVAAKPQCVTEAEVDAETIEKERHIYTEQAIASGKPAEIAAKMVEGRIRKFLAEITLNGQAFVMNPDQTVAQFAKENGTEVVSFVRYKVGDGIEKKAVDYAAEVAAAAKV